MKMSTSLFLVLGSLYFSLSNATMIMFHLYEKPAYGVVLQKCWILLLKSLLFFSGCCHIKLHSCPCHGYYEKIFLAWGTLVHIGMDRWILMGAWGLQESLSLLPWICEISIAYTHVATCCKLFFLSSEGPWNCCNWACWTRNGKSWGWCGDFGANAGKFYPIPENLLVD